MASVRTGPSPEQAKYRDGGSGSNRAEAQWRIVYDAIGTGGRNKRPYFEDQIIAEVVSALGWQPLCGLTTYQLNGECAWKFQKLNQEREAAA